MQTDLRGTYLRVAPLLDGCETFAVAEAVERVRTFWKPARATVILLAESHVFTSERELAIPLRQSHLPVENPPSEFVRFVYCLGYGENAVLTRPVTGNLGTPQYWKIFNDCCFAPSASSASAILVSRNPNLHHRLAAKVALLERLRSRGIWLVDASITAIYRPGAQRPKPKTVERVLSICWDSYVRYVVQSENPRHIIVVGRGVGAALHGRLREFHGRYTILPQPQARASSAELAETRRTYFALCSEYAAA